MWMSIAMSALLGPATAFTLAMATYGYRYSLALALVLVLRLGFWRTFLTRRRGSRGLFQVADVFLWECTWALGFAWLFFVFGFFFVLKSSTDFDFDLCLDCRRQKGNNRKRQQTTDGQTSLTAQTTETSRQPQLQNCNTATEQQQQQQQQKQWGFTHKIFRQTLPNHANNFWLSILSVNAEARYIFNRLPFKFRLIFG